MEKATFIVEFRSEDCEGNKQNNKQAIEDIINMISEYWNVEAIEVNACGCLPDLLESCGNLLKAQSMQEEADFKAYIELATEQARYAISKLKHL